jgi:hypothetical protein
MAYQGISIFGMKQPAQYDPAFYIEWRKMCVSCTMQTFFQRKWSGVNSVVDLERCQMEQIGMVIELPQLLKWGLEQRLRGKPELVSQMMNTVDETGDRLVERPTRSITNGSPYP